MSREQRQNNAGRIADRQATRFQSGKHQFDFNEYNEDFWDKLQLIEACPRTRQGRPTKRTLYK